MNLERDTLTETVIGLASEVHRELGPGLAEQGYEAALEFELRRAGMHCARQVVVDVSYKGRAMEVGSR